MTVNFDAHARTYAEGPARQVPGLDGLHRMTALLLTERMPADGQVLVLGAGGGLEIRALADLQPGWRFMGIDPSAEMLKLAGQIAGAHASRVELRQGYIADAPEGPFDAATCILVMHFVLREQRLETLRQLRRRLRPGAPLVMAHISFAQSEPERSTWIARHVAFPNPVGADPAGMEASRQAIATRLTILSPDGEEAMLREAGFTDVSMFYAALSFRGWVAYA